jgi:hypothetical protein
MNRHHSGGEKGNISDTCSVIKRDVFSRVYHMCQEKLVFLHLLNRSGFSENRGILITTPLFSYESTSFDKSLPSVELC